MVAGRVPVVLVLVLVLVNRGRSFNGPAPAVKSRRELFSPLETDPARATEPFEHEHEHDQKRITTNHGRESDIGRLHRDDLQ